MLASLLYQGTQNQTLFQMQSHKCQDDRNTHFSQLLASFLLSKGTLLTHIQLGVHQESDVICFLATGSQPVLLCRVILFQFSDSFDECHEVLVGPFQPAEVPQKSSPALQHTQPGVINRLADGAFHCLIQVVNEDYKCKTALFNLTEY